jgi:SulP family sulfate permease
VRRSSVTTLAAWGFGLADRACAIVGEVPQGLPPLTMPGLRSDLWGASGRLGDPDLDHRLRRIGLGGADARRQEAPAHRPRSGTDRPRRANLGAAVTGGYPVTGGFARSVVNFDAGAETPAAGAFTAVGIASPRCSDAAGLLPAQGDAGRDDHRRGAVACRFLDPEERPGAIPADFAAVAATILLTLGFGVEVGVSAGVALSIFCISTRPRARMWPRSGWCPAPAFPQHQAPQGADPSRGGDAAGRREPLFRQCALSRGPP